MSTVLDSERSEPKGSSKAPTGLRTAATPTTLGPELDPGSDE